MSEELRIEILSQYQVEERKKMELEAYKKAYDALFKRSSFLYDYFIHIEESWVKQALKEYLNDIKAIDSELLNFIPPRNIIKIGQ